MILIYIKKNQDKKKKIINSAPIFIRGVNPVPVPGYWPKSGTGTGVPGY